MTTSTMRVLPARPRLTPRQKAAVPMSDWVDDLDGWEPVLFGGAPRTAVVTRMEKNVLESLCEGKSNRMIGKDYGISEDTVKSHVRNVMAKVGGRDRTHTVALVYSRAVLVKVCPAVGRWASLPAA